MGGGTEGRAQRTLLSARHLVLPGVCAAALEAPVLRGVRRVCASPYGEADGDDPPVDSAGAGLVAARAARLRREAAYVRDGGRFQHHHLDRHGAPGLRELGRDALRGPADFQRADLLCELSAT